MNNRSCHISELQQQKNITNDEAELVTIESDQDVKCMFQEVKDVSSMVVKKEESRVPALSNTVSAIHAGRALVCDEILVFLQYINMVEYMLVI